MEKNNDTDDIIVSYNKRRKIEDSISNVFLEYINNNNNNTKNIKDIPLNFKKEYEENSTCFKELKELFHDYIHNNINKENSQHNFSNKSISKNMEQVFKTLFDSLKEKEKAKAFLASNLPTPLVNTEELINLDDGFIEKLTKTEANECVLNFLNKLKKDENDILSDKDKNTALYEEAFRIIVLYVMYNCKPLEYNINMNHRTKINIDPKDFLQFLTCIHSFAISVSYHVSWFEKIVKSGITNDFVLKNIHINDILSLFIIIMQMMSNRAFKDLDLIDIELEHTQK